MIEKDIILTIYLDFTNLCLKKVTTKSLKYSAINKYLIKLKSTKKPFYKLIDGLELVELEILKTYIKINLINSFIHTFKFFNGAFILFLQIFISNFCLCINY